ncbi:hypothetical protein, partial [Legionella qingyii]|uniref:hypothetical protein n=1 Tax=Legionella qingyii TaxID=2184757 RepID=UPI00197BF352
FRNLRSNAAGIGDHFAPEYTRIKLMASSSLTCDQKNVLQGELSTGLSFTINQTKQIYPYFYLPGYFKYH